MDEDERDYDQVSFERALFKLIDDPRAHDVDVVRALAVWLSVKIAVDTEAGFVAAREKVLWIIKGMLLGIEPMRREHEEVDSVIAKIDAAIWPARRCNDDYGI